jgi:hypothetical protein
MAGDVDCLGRSQRAHQRIEIGNIVGEPVSVPRRFGRPNPRQSVRARANRPRALDQKLERRRDIHPAMQQKQLARAPGSPHAHVIGKPANGT